MDNNGIELEEVHPIDDYSNLPIRIFPLGRANIIVRGNIDPKDILGLADVTLQTDPLLVRVKLSVWADSGSAKAWDLQLFIGGMKYRGSQETLFVFDPNDVRILTTDEEQLGEFVKEDGYFWQVALFYGANLLRDHLDHTLEDAELTVEYKGFQKFPEPKKRQFGINKKADLYLGDLVFEVTTNV